jgi:multicomponent Na+:H+ antiporter subunit G
MMQIIGDVFIIVGALLLVLAAWGVIALPDALARQHAATKAGTFALAQVCIGAIVFGFSFDWTWRLLLIVGFLMATLPVASHLLARAAVREDPDHNDISNAQLIGDDPAQRAAIKDGSA